ncbi:hypothetical protein JI667_06410 [Bacillus sp. NTK074B]|uniref:hypothetical protein n=1 Tax=Bacillus sp. NTK074B TaxID=2802174 RepID=UPI001A8EF428|nr:hypothetical protein [Bacillus sp. NTK074B]
MNKYNLLIMFGLLALVLSGCAASKKEVKIAGYVKTVGNTVSVNGTSILEADSKIKIELKDIETDAVLEEAVAKVNKDHTYSASFKRDEKAEEHKLVVTFNPDDQPDAIQNIYGRHGENIREGSPGLVRIRKDGDEYACIQMFDFIYKVEKGSPRQNTFLLDYFNHPGGGGE